MIAEQPERAAPAQEPGGLSSEDGAGEAIATSCAPSSIGTLIVRLPERSVKRSARYQPGSRCTASSADSARCTTPSANGLTSTSWSPMAPFTYRAYTPSLITARRHDEKAT